MVKKYAILTCNGLDKSKAGRVAREIAFQISENDWKVKSSVLFCTVADARYKK